MPIRKVRSKKFKLQKEAIAWAKKEKERSLTPLRWETNRTKSPTKPWEAVMYKSI